MNIEKLWGLWSARVEQDGAIHKDAFAEVINDWLAAERDVLIKREPAQPCDAALDANMAARHAAYQKTLVSARGLGDGAIFVKSPLTGTVMRWWVSDCQGEG